jgi:hypothetical protein
LFGCLTLPVALITQVLDAAIGVAEKLTLAQLGAALLSELVAEEAAQLVGAVPRAAIGPPASSSCGATVGWEPYSILANVGGTMDSMVSAIAKRVTQQGLLGGSLPKLGDVEPSRIPALCKIEFIISINPL